MLFASRKHSPKLWRCRRKGELISGAKGVMVLRGETAELRRVVGIDWCRILHLGQACFGQVPR